MNRPLRTSNDWPSLPLTAPAARTGDRFVLREWRAGDAGALVEAWSDELVRQWLNPPEPTIDVARHWIEGCEGRHQTGLALDLVVEVDGRVAGEVGLSSFDDGRRSALIGYWVAPDNRGTGLAAEAVARLADWFLGALDGTALLAQCHPVNIASHRTAERAGFNKLGTHDEHVVYVRQATASGCVRSN